MKIRKLTRLNPVYWSLIIFIVAQIITFAVITREDAFLTEEQIYVPSQPTETVTLWPETTVSPSGEVTGTPVYSSLGPVLIYFFAVVVVLGIILFLVPLFVLKIILKGLFAFLFGWGTFIILIMWLPLVITLFLAAAIGVTWFFYPRIWLHNIALVLSLCAVGAVFGRFLSPWTSMILLAALAVYDFLAVRFGYMMWMAKKLSDSNTLPAFIIPRSIKDWNMSLTQSSVAQIASEEPAERQYSILGGGDIGFALLLMSSVYFSRGFTASVIIAVFTIIGLLCAYWIQATIARGKPVPALPPIAAVSLIGLVMVSALPI